MSGCFEIHQYADLADPPLAVLPTLTDVRLWLWNHGHRPDAKHERRIVRGQNVYRESQVMEGWRPAWTCIGSVRGECGTVHRSHDAALRCCEADQKACQRFGGGSYSDRRPVPVDAT